MDYNLLNPEMNQEENLASGDASCTNQLVLSSSLTDLLPHPCTDVQEECKSPGIWKYKVEKQRKPSSDGCKGCTPIFFPIGSLRKTQYRDSSKRQVKTKPYKVKSEKKLSDRNNKNPKGSHSNECFTPQESQPLCNFVNLAKLFSCQSCLTSPITSATVHMCSNGHQVCGNCLHHSRSCRLCGEPLKGRNHPVEVALQKLKLLRPELFFHERLILADKDRSTEGSHFKGHQSSHKPVRCPHLSCRSTVAYNGFLLHFKFEHSGVPKLTTAIDSPHHFPLSESLLTHNAPRVVTVFQVNQIKTSTRKLQTDPVMCCLLSVPIEIGYVKSLAVWCSGVWFNGDGSSAPLTYTLSTPHSRRSIAYHGPIASLHEHAESILTDGRCLIVPSEKLENFPLQNESLNILQIEFFLNN